MSHASFNYIAPCVQAVLRQSPPLCSSMHAHISLVLQTLCLCITCFYRLTYALSGVNFSLICTGASKPMSMLLVLLQVAQTDDSPETCFWAKQDLQRVISEEKQWRCKLWSTGAFAQLACLGTNTPVLYS